MSCQQYPDPQQTVCPYYSHKSPITDSITPLPAYWNEATLNSLSMIKSDSNQNSDHPA